MDVSKHAEKWTFSLDESTVLGRYYWTKLHAILRSIVICITGRFVEFWTLCKLFTNGCFAGRKY